MRQIFVAILSSFKDFYDEMFLFVAVNLLCILLFIPVVTVAPALAGVYHVTNKSAHGRFAVTWKDFFVGFRRYFAKSWQLLLADLVLLVMIVLNINFYAGMPYEVLKAVSILWLYVLAWWACLQIYLFPLLMEQDNPRLLLIFRNAVVLTVKHPLSTIVLLLVILLLLLVSTALVIPAVLLLLSLVASISNRALLTLIGEHLEKAN